MALSLIAGGAGFLGSHLAEALLARGHDVVIADNFSHGMPENLARIRDRVEILPGDLRSHTFTRRAMRGVDCAFHFAVPWGSSSSGELTAPCAGVFGSWHLLLAARDAGCRRVVLASSGELYDRSSRSPVDENALTVAVTTAAKEAVLIEQEAVSFARSFGLGLLRLRFFNVFGPRQRAGALGPNVQRMLDAMLHGKRPVLYEHELGNHDLLCVNEAVRACFLASESDRSDGRIYNIASGRPVNSLDLVSRLNLILGTELPAILAGPCSSAPPIALPDVKRAKSELGFTADFDLDERLIECVNYSRCQSGNLEVVSKGKPIFRIS